MTQRGLSWISATRNSHLAIIGLISLAATLAVYNHIIVRGIISPTLRGFAVLAFFALCMLMVRRTVLGFAMPRINSFSPKTLCVWTGASLAAGFLLIKVIPIPISIPQLQTAHHLELTALGQKNPDATASNVWVLGLFDSTGTEISPWEFSKQGTWRRSNGSLISFGNDQPATLNWKGTLQGQVRLALASNSRSGIVKVVWDGATRTIDLYSKSPNDLKEIVLSPPGNQKPGVGIHVYRVVLFSAYGIALGWLVFVAFIFLTTWSPAKEPAVPVKRWAWVWYALPCVAVWTVYLLAIWPGSMTADSLYQWRQALLETPFNDHHPVFHTLTIWLTIQFWTSPAAVVLTQILALAALTGAGLAMTQGMGAPRGVVWLTSFIFAFAIPNGFMVVTIWKDIPYSLGVLALTLLVLKIVTSNGIWLHGRRTWIVLGLAAAFVALIRHNGPPAAFGTLIVLLLVYRRHWRPLVAALVLSILLWTGVRGPVYDILQVQRQVQNLGGFLFYHQLVAHLVAGTPLEEDEQEFLFKANPRGRDIPYSCRTVYPNVWDPKLNMGALWANPREVIRLWIVLNLRAPMVALRHIGCNSSFIWRIMKPPNSYFAGAAIGIGTNKSGLKNDSLLPRLRGLLIKAWNGTHLDRTILSLVWRPAFYLYLLLAGLVVVAVRNRSWKYLVVAAPVIFHSLFIVLIPLDETFRYMYPLYVVSLLLAPSMLFTSAMPRERSAGAEEIETKIKAEG